MAKDVEPVFEALEKIVEEVAEAAAMAAVTVFLPGIGEVFDAALSTSTPSIETSFQHSQRC